MLPYPEMFRIQVHGCWLNLTKTLIPPAEEPKILFAAIFYSLQNEGISYDVYFFLLSMLLVITKTL